MQSLKNEFILPPVLALPNSTGHLALDTDTCDVQDRCFNLNKKRDRPVKRIEYW